GTKGITIPCPAWIGFASIWGTKPSLPKTCWNDACIFSMLKISYQSAGEEHLVLKAPEGHEWQVGDLLYGLPAHICPTVALYDWLTVVQYQRTAGTWEVFARKWH